MILVLRNIKQAYPNGVAETKNYRFTAEVEYRGTVLEDGSCVLIDDLGREVIVQSSNEYTKSQYDYIVRDISRIDMFLCLHR